MTEAAVTESLKKLPLDALWRGRAKKWGAFAGYDMPLEFEGLIAEHNWTRTHAGLFDVSHMGPCLLSFLWRERLEPNEEFAALAHVLETLAPADIKGLRPGQIRYTMLLNSEGGVLDDLMIARADSMELAGCAQAVYLVVNAGTKDQDFALIEAAASSAGEWAKFGPFRDLSLLALQGPDAEAVLARFFPQVRDLKFMTLSADDNFFADNLYAGVDPSLEQPDQGVAFISRSGYTGEDGFEILLTPEHARVLVSGLLADPRVKPVGLGARDSLRLEAGLCLYGHDLDPTISPIEAGLAWTIQKRRREAADFPGADRILHELRDGPVRKRVGIRPRDRAPAREGVEIHKDGRRIGAVTSGGFSPTLNAPISMGYVETAFSAPGTSLELMVRGQPRPAEIVPLPFVPHRYVR
jgi:aminomethyltransferase